MHSVQTRRIVHMLLVVGSLLCLQQNSVAQDQWTRYAQPYGATFYGLLHWPNVVLGVSINLCRSTDDGISWVEMATGRPRTLATDTGGLGWITGSGGSAYTTNSGANWYAAPTNSVYY